jgi:aspartate aminotransferase
MHTSETMSVLQGAERLPAQGVDVADFGPGEPDFPTPEHTQRAAIEVLEENHTKDTPAIGIASLCQAICDWHAAQFGTSYESFECAVNVGGKHAIFNAVCSVVNPGDEVLIPAHCWVSYPEIVRCADGIPVLVPTHAEDNFCLRAAEVEKAMTSQTRFVIVNSPNNPTGAVIRPDEFAKILAVCGRHGAWLLSDECYSHFTYGDAKPFSVASLPGAKRGVIIAGAFSKAFAMTRWHIGYVLAPRPVIEAVTKLQSQSTSNPNSIGQNAKLEAMRGPMDGVAMMRAEYARRRERILAGLRAIPRVACATPEGAFHVSPDASAHLHREMPDDAAIAKHLLNRAHGSVVPGGDFGAPGHLRLSCVTSTETIEEGLRQLTSFFGQTT